MAHPPRIPVWLPLDRAVVYFVTFCVQDRPLVLANAATFGALEHAIARLCDWHVYAALLMPDHVHVLAAPTRDRDAAVGNLVGALKRWIRQDLVGRPLRLPSAPAGQSARLAWEWQPGSFDRLLRTDESAQAKWEYVRANPVRKGLVKTWDQWPYSTGFRPHPEL